MSSVATEATLAETAVDYADTRDAAFAGVRALVVRHLSVGVLSALGTTVVIRQLGPQLWGAFGVAYLLLVTVDAIVARGILAGLARRSVAADASLVSSAERLALYAGVVLAAAVLAMAPVIELFYDPPAFTKLLASSAIACFLYALRAVPSILLERDLRYGPIAAGEFADNLAFYAVAVPAILFLHWGLAALGAGMVARALASLVVIRGAYAAPWIGRSARDAARLLLPFGAPLCATFVIGLVDALVAVVVIGGHERQLGFMLFAGTVLGYGVAVVTAATRVALPSFSRVDSVRLGWTVRRSVALASFLTFAVLGPAIGLAEVWVVPVFGPVWSLGGVAYLQLVGVALLAMAPVGVLGGALLARGSSRLLMKCHAVTIALYAALAFALVAAVGPIGCVIALAVARWFYVVLLGFVSRRPLGFLIDAVMARVVLLGAAGTAVAAFLAPRSPLAAIAAVVLLGALWVWACGDLARASFRAARTRIGRA
jgi:O-antigen/teichoic acid export membrane protein